MSIQTADGYADGLLFAPHEEAVAAGEALALAMPKDRPIAVICLGSPDIAWDSFGPRVGSFLERAVLPAGVEAWGTMDMPIGLPDADMPDTDKAIRSEIAPNAWVLVVDVGDGLKGRLYIRGPVRPPRPWLVKLVNRIAEKRGHVPSGWSKNTSRKVGDASLILGGLPLPCEWDVPVKALRAATAILYALRKRQDADSN